MAQAWSMQKASYQRFFTPVKGDNSRSKSWVEVRVAALNKVKILVKYRINYFFKPQMKAVYHRHVIEGAVLMNMSWLLCSGPSLQRASTVFMAEVT